MNLINLITIYMNQHLKFKIKYDNFDYINIMILSNEHCNYQIINSISLFDQTLGL